MPFTILGVLVSNLNYFLTSDHIVYPIDHFELFGSTYGLSANVECPSNEKTGFDKARQCELETKYWTLHYVLSKFSAHVHHSTVFEYEKYIGCL